MTSNTDFSGRQASKTVAVVVPMHNRVELAPEEEISLRHLVHFLGKYDKYLVVPESLNINYPGFGIKRFDDSFFGSTQAHTQLNFSPRYYKAFMDYKYILVYQLDCLVFSDQLEQWCELDLDFIGAPWIKHKDTPYFGMPATEGKVGNAGFSLRKIESFLKIIYSSTYQIEPKKYWGMYYGKQPKHIQYMNLPKKFLKYLRFFNNVRREMSTFNGNDDTFFANRATHYYPEFKIAAVETALRFAFECVPRYCFELNNYTLPFGCHAWHKYDRDFWEPYLLK
jgi:hypothetical protein